jgi:hypothetical protein
VWDDVSNAGGALLNDCGNSGRTPCSSSGTLLVAGR